ncbi:NAD-dependent epimerase/dehydratase family protein [Agaricicola taiwanensis]|nr:NAD-dependent epimerase/dehydratase family protein [Agaricicola taiwanensis]
MTTLLLLGYGYAAERIAERHADRFGKLIVTARSADNVDALRARGLDAYLFDGTGVSAELSLALRPVTHVVSSIPPAEASDPVLAALAPELARSPNLAAVGYLSTTGVYGDRLGAWVDEDTEPQPNGPRGHRRLQAENQWRAFAEGSGATAIILRLPGIYGPGRNTLMQLRAGTAKRIVKPGQVFSRIHVDDLADAVAAALLNPSAGRIWNVADDEPAPPQDVVTYAARLMGLEPPPAVLFEEAQLSDMAQSFWADNKRVANRGIRDRLGVTLTYPTYREGLHALWTQSNGG